MRRLLVLAFAVLATVAAVYALWELRSAVLLLALSLATASAVAPIVEFWTTHGVRRALALAVTYGLALSAVFLLLYFTTGSVIVDFEGLTDDAVRAHERLRTTEAGGSFLHTLATRLPLPEVDGALDSSSKLTGAARGAVGVTLEAVSLLADFVIVIVLSIFWSANSRGFERLWLSLLPVEQRARARETWDAIQTGVGEQIRSDIVQSLAAVVILLVGFHAMGLHYPTLPAVAGGVLRLVPLVGTLLAVLATLLSELATDPLLAGLAAVYTVAVLWVLGRLVAPRLLRSRRHSAILVTLLVVALSDAYGLAGLLVAPACAAAIQVFFEKLLGSLQPAPEPVFTLGQLEERLAALNRLVAERGGDPPPELASLVQRMSRLVGEVEGAHVPASAAG